MINADYFDQVIDRRHSGSIKWDCGPNELPMWVADMDFAIAPCLQKTLQNRIAHPIFGYTEPNETWKMAFHDFMMRRHQVDFSLDWSIFSTGVIPSMSSSVRAFSEVGDEVVTLTPVYPVFFHSITNNHRIQVNVPMIYDQKGYFIDFAALEKAFASPKAKLFLLCNPANPISRIWTKEELIRIATLAKRYSVLVFADEVHGEIVSPDASYVPFLSVSPEAREVGIMATAVTKAFNVAGIPGSIAVVPNPMFRERLATQLNTDECGEPNVFSIPLAISAWRDGEEWLDAMREYVFRNRKSVETFLSSYLPELTLVPGKATYLLWVDISNIAKNSMSFCSFLREKTGLWITPGSEYGEDGEGFVRINVACPRSRLEDGLKRLYQGVLLWKQRESAVLK